MKIFAQLTKFGIVIFVLMAGLAGYALGYRAESHFEGLHLLCTLLGLYFLSSGSLALNQVQEFELDKKMPRTAKRPIVTGQISRKSAFIISCILLILGSVFLIKVSWLAFIFGISTVILYNGIYTYYWKPKWIYAAVPGAIPGALPVTIGYTAINSDFLSSESIYLFLILFLWQMPHFWALAIKFKDDYSSGGVPTLPATLGLSKTILQMGVYTFLYVGMAWASPWFVPASWVYLLFVFPTGAKLLWEFYRFQKSAGQEGWLRFFMWINVSILVFMFVPLFDKWSFLLEGHSH